MKVLLPIADTKIQNNLGFTPEALKAIKAGLDRQSWPLSWRFGRQTVGGTITGSARIEGSQLVTAAYLSPPWLDTDGLIRVLRAQEWAIALEVIVLQKERLTGAQRSHRPPPAVCQDARLKRLAVALRQPQDHRPPIQPWEGRAA